jgi:hypothetical protein
MADKSLVREIKEAEKEIKSAKHITELRKQQFIYEIKNGLGEKIKNNPRAVKTVRKKWYERLWIFIKKFITKF